MLSSLKPIAYALFLWWFSTGAIIWLDGLPRRTFRWSVLGASVLFAVSLAGIHLDAGDTSLAAAYRGFTFGLLAWAWHEITFYMGWVTGPRQVRCEEGCSGWAHFGHAIQASLWHELAILCSAAAIAWLSHDQPNQVALSTFLTLWVMHQSAKLNVFLGVRNLNAHFLPEHLDFLRGFLRQRPMNLLFPLSISASTVGLVALANQAAALPADSFARNGLLLVASVLALGILEHWFLVLPLPFAALWNWSVRRSEQAPRFQVDLVAGFLGSGKTTVMRRLLAEQPAGARVMVLANDFSDVGIDGALLSGRGAEVVEFSNGCICCSLQQDLGRQLSRLAQQYRPERVLIEPSGVADVAALMQALARPPLAELVAGLRVMTVVDAASFLGDYARMPGYFEAQTRVSPLVLVNKTDLVHEGSLEVIRHTLLAAHPGVRIALARYGQPVEGLTIGALLDQPETARRQTAAARTPVWPAAGPAVAGRAPGARALHASGEVALGLQSWSTTLSGVCDPARLRDLLDILAAGQFGQLERVKGIVRAEAGWVRFDLAGGRPAIAAHAARSGELPRVMAIGRDVDGPGLLQAFLDCTLPGALQHG